MSQHTPAPWECDWDDIGVYATALKTPCIVVRDDGTIDHGFHGLIARVYGGDHQFGNLRLIAKAPEMLAWLQKFAPFGCVHDHVAAGPKTGDCRCAGCQARALLREVEGA